MGLQKFLCRPNPCVICGMVVFWGISTLPQCNRRSVSAVPDLGLEASAISVFQTRSSFGTAMLLPLAKEQPQADSGRFVLRRATLNLCLRYPRRHHVTLVAKHKTELQEPNRLRGALLTPFTGIKKERPMQNQSPLAPEVLAAKCWPSPASNRVRTLSRSSNN